MKKIEDVLTKKEIKYMTGIRKGQEVTIERHIINGKSVKVKKSYVRETFEKNALDDIERWLKKGLGAKKILKYEKDECSFRWVVWYI